MCQAQEMKSCHVGLPAQAGCGGIGDQAPLRKASNVGAARFSRCAAQMHRHPDLRALELALMKEPQPRRKVRDDGGRLVPRPGKDRRGTRLVMVLEETRQPVLVVEPRLQMGANGAGIGMAKAIVEALVVAVVEALLLQFPF